MKEIKNILLGISVILIVILVHLTVDELLLTDFLAIIGIGLIIANIKSK
ncbi:MAG: hypothetical protein WAV55_00375 [Clostridiaceae bacterium]